LSNPGIDDVARALTEVSERKLDCDHPVEAKPFPLEVLPDSLGNYVQSAAASIGCEEAMIAVPLLAGLSGTIGNTYHVEVTSSWRSSCMLWTMILALSGSGKSPALDLAIKPIRELAADFDREFETKRAQYKAEVVGYERQVKAARKNGNNPGPEPVRPVRRRIDFHDATVEALAQVLSKNTRGGVLIADEIAVWLHGLNMYKSGGRGTDMAKWNEIWNGNTLRIDRKTGDERELHVARPFMAVTGGIQTGVFLQHVDRDSLDSGMLARILVTVSTSIKRPGNRQPVDRQLYQSVLCTYRKLARLDFIRTSDSERPRYIPLCPEALTRFHDWREHWEAETARILNDGIAATMTKLVSYVPRFALILHLTQRVQSNQASTGFTPIETIDLDTVNKAICLAEWFGNEARRVHALVKIPSTTHEELREKILEVVDAKGGWMSVRDVCREHRETRATEARMVLEELASRRLLERRQPAGSTTGRRPGPEFRSISAT
jgi:hypothetical protein